MYDNDMMNAFVHGLRMEDTENKPIMNEISMNNE